MKRILFHTVLTLTLLALGILLITSELIDGATFVLALFLFDFVILRILIQHYKIRIK